MIEMIWISFNNYMRNRLTRWQETGSAGKNEGSLKIEKSATIQWKITMRRKKI